MMLLLMTVAHIPGLGVKDFALTKPFLCGRSQLDKFEQQASALPRYSPACVNSEESST